MKNHSHLSRLSACLLAICVLFVSACFRDGPPLQAAMVEGSRTLTEAEVFNRYAGNSIRFDVTADAKGWYREIYFGKDGTYQVVQFFNEAIEEGTWETIGTPYGGYKFNSIYLRYNDGELDRNEKHSRVLVNVRPDGTAIIFNSGSIQRQPKPTPGFQGRARFNEIKRKISAAAP